MDSTIEEVLNTRSSKAPWGRRLGTTILTLFIVSGAAGLLGDSVAMEVARESGYTLELEYPQRSRAGLDVPWELKISRTLPLPPEITVAVTSGYFDLFEQQGLDPEAIAQTADTELEYWTFTTPSGNSMAISVDHYVEPGVMRGASGTVALLVDGKLIAPIDFTTRMLP